MVRVGDGFDAIRRSVGGIGRVHVHVFLRWDTLDQSDEALLVCHAGSSCCDPWKMRVCGLVGEEGVRFEDEVIVRLLLLNTVVRRLISDILRETLSVLISGNFHS